MAPFPRTPADIVQEQFRQHLLSPEQLQDRTWRPDCPVAEFIRHRIRVTVFLLQRVTCDENGLNGPVPVILPAEQVEIRGMIRAVLATIVGLLVHFSPSRAVMVFPQRSLSRVRQYASAQFHMLRAANRPTSSLLVQFGVPAQAARCFSILLKIIERFPPQTPDEQMANDLMHPVLVALYTSARDTAHASGAPMEFPEYAADGDVKLDVSDADFGPLEYVLPGMILVSPDSIS